MALTVTVTDNGVMGKKRTKMGTITFDSSYDVGGETFDKATIGLVQLDLLVMPPKGGFAFEWNATTSKIMILESGTASARLDEEDAATDQSALTVTFFAVGH